MSSAIGRDLKARNGNFNFDVQVWVKFFSSLLETDAALPGGLWDPSGEQPGGVNWGESKDSDPEE